MPDIVYGVTAIGAVIGESNERKVYYRLEQGQIPGAWKAGRTWALTVPQFRRAVGIDTANAISERPQPEAAA
jgi:hypothetical protein